MLSFTWFVEQITIPLYKPFRKGVFYATKQFEYPDVGPHCSGWYFGRCCRCSGCHGGKPPINTDN
jgi:hypothetical protein